MSAGQRIALDYRLFLSPNNSFSVLEKNTLNFYDGAEMKVPIRARNLRTPFDVKSEHAQ